MGQFLAGVLSGAAMWSVMVPELKRRARKAKKVVKSVVGTQRVSTRRR